jgi:hypothetical protein
VTRTVLLLVVAVELAAALLLTRSIVAARQFQAAVVDPEPAAPVGPTAEPVIEPAPLHCPAPHVLPTFPVPTFVPRAWGQEQACGPPDSPNGGDVATAWAPATADGQNEWLELTYAEAVQPIAVLIFEACGPGAVSQIEFESDAGKWVTVWGEDPKPVVGNLRIVNAPIESDFATRRIRVSILSTMVPYWNEIDAVGLLDGRGKVHWALSAIASSSYAGDSSEPLPPR